MNRDGKRIKPKATRLTEAQRCEILVESERDTGFKGIEALPITVLGIDDQLLCSDVQTEAAQMHDELHRPCETFQQNINKLALNAKRRKFMRSPQMTLRDMSKQ